MGLFRIGVSLNIVAFVHFYPPFRNAGSERMLHTLLLALVAAGHSVTVVSTDTPEAPYQYLYDGVRVFSAQHWMARQILRDLRPDVVVTHHQNTGAAVKLAATINAKSVFLVHNDFDENRERLSLNPDLVVFNTTWIKQATGYPGRSAVVHPPVWPDAHRSPRGDRVAFANLSIYKGAGLFYELAGRMPDTGFLGVVGAYGHQVIRDLPNVDVVDHTDDMPGDVWCRTRVLLVPSEYESYGMIAVEAMTSGIPVLATPTPGLKESLGPAGIFLDRDRPDDWVRVLRRLEDPDEYKAASDAVLKRSNELDPVGELSRWVTEIEGLV